MSPAFRATTRVGRSRGTAAVLIAVLLSGFVALGGTTSAHAADPPPAVDGVSASIDPGKSGVGEKVAIVGNGWTPASLVQATICGENAMRGSVNCAGAASATVGPAGGVTMMLDTVIPPSPCPCVVKVATVTGGVPKDISVPLEIDGAPFAPLPVNVKTPGRLQFIDSAMVGEDTIFTWFGSPVQRRFQVKVGNMGQSPIVNPKFRVGFYEGVYAPTWDTAEVQVTIQPGEHKTISLPVELKPRQHGTFSWRVMYNDQIVDEQALDVGRPWGVYIFGALLVLVIPVAIWRLALRIVEVIREQGTRRSKESDREVGLPESSSLLAKDGKNKKSAGEADHDASAAKTSNRRPADVEADKVDLSKRPIRSMVETMVIGGPLYADSEPGEDDHPGATDIGRGA
ncbi:hypothetical protein [Streptomyces sp. SID3343]|uniref:hypothetical protein n=1 Tax=Streptomyces sp. SID3343 TaxID=2690260 RepID=UPI0013687E39|nr:hypothetical protein [Streptomyces sp. SID3343]MYW03651.1 hypothetical protein [Streptomyces sp. SID3343]